MKDKMILILAVGFPLLIGIALSISGYCVIVSAIASSSWPKVQGQIIASDIKRRHSDRGRVIHTAKVFYKYSVNATKYSSNKISFGEYNHAGRIVNLYRKGKTVWVYYNPEKPQIAVLEPGISWDSFFLLGMGVLFIFASYSQTKT